MVLPAGSTGSEIVLTVIDNLGNRTTLAGNYSVNVAASTVTYPTVGGVSPLGVGINALPVGWSLSIARVVPLSQLLSIITQGVFDGPSFSAALDRLAMFAQQLQDQLNRCLQYPVGTAPTAAMLNPATVLLTVAPLISNGAYAALQAQAAAAPTVQFWGFATDLGASGTLVFYCGNPTAGSNGNGFYIVPAG